MNFPQEGRTSSWVGKVMIPVGGLGGALAMGLVAAGQPFLAIATAVVALLALTALALPDVSTLVVIFILYTNAAVIAARFHGVPTFVSSSLPALLIIPLAHYLIVRRQDLIVNPIMPLLFLFLIVQVIGAIFSVNTRVSFNNVINYLVEGLGLYLLITNVARTQEMLRRAIWVLLLAGAFMGSLSVYQQMTHTFDNNYGGFAQMSNAAFGTGTENLFGEDTQPRLAGPIGEQNRYAQNMLMLVPLGLFRFWGERSKRLRILAAIATALITLGAALTFSRGAAVGLILMLVITALMGYIKPFQAVIIGLGLVLLLQVVPEYGTRLDTLGDVSSAVTTQGGGGLSTTDGATQSRMTEMMAAAMVFADYPIVGVGPGMYRYYYQDYAERVGLRTLSGDRQAHDLYVSIAAENGALGLIAFGAIVFVTLRSLAKTRKRWGQSRPDIANLVTGFILSIVAYLATGVFLHSAFIRFFWLIMALAGAASYIAANSAEAADDRKGVAAL